MSTERLMMQGKLGELEREKKKLHIKGKGLCESIRPQINPTMLEIDEMEIATAAQQMDDLVMVQAELISLSGKIKQLERELGC
jgi:hypothetical protein